VTHLGSLDLSIDAARRFRKRITAGRFDLAFAASRLIGLGAPLIVGCGIEKLIQPQIDTRARTCDPRRAFLGGAIVHQKCNAGSRRIELMMIRNRQLVAKCKDLQVQRRARTNQEPQGLE
jgi:hypothetical protein